MNKNKYAYQMIFIILLGCLIMALTDGILHLNYILKSFIKIIFFFIIPVIYTFYHKEINMKSLFKSDKQSLLLSSGLGFIVYILIICGYFMMCNFYDFNSITSLLDKNVGVTKNNFIYVSIYISFINSLLEEFFFRGFAFLLLSQYISLKAAYLFSSVSFALYHIAIMSGWFSPLLFILMLIILTIGGLIFNYLDIKKRTIYSSWMVHMFANFSINTIGFILFGII